MTPPRESTSATLVNALAVATAECTALMNEQFLALIAHEPDMKRFDGKIAEAILRRKAAMEALLNHVTTYGW
jgi:hypothetical protein